MEKGIIKLGNENFKEQKSTTREIMENGKELEKIAIKMINDYLYYGYGLDTWLKQDYNITKELGLEKIKELWKKQTKKLGNEGN